MSMVHERPTARRIETSIARHGELSASRSVYARRNTALYGARRMIPASRTIAMRLADPDEPKPRSTVVTVGEEGLPAGFGKQVLWAQEDTALAIVVFLNAGDPLGVMISGARRTDTIKFVSAAGDGPDRRRAGSARCDPHGALPPTVATTTSTHRRVAVQRPRSRLRPARRSAQRRARHRRATRMFLCTC
jgi:hypothetical protein